MEDFTYIYGTNPITIQITSMLCGKQFSNLAGSVVKKEKYL